MLTTTKLLTLVGRRSVPRHLARTCRVSNTVSTWWVRAWSAVPKTNEALSVEEMMVAIEGMNKPDQATVPDTVDTTLAKKIVTKDNNTLPKTLVQALKPTDQAIVITESTPPYRVWNVNSAWQKLCGYTLLEARHHTLGSLLANSEVNSVKAIDLAHQLLKQERQEVEATFVNYKKCGRRFVDHLRLGCLVNERGRVTHFVGAVEEVTVA
mmetsp:Transcript_5197/g.9970  ORF Transcript_5197/g.9970 Transcript_5197/m.9970 type:complete len:210 (-) Transcript_5197:183-812(-)